MGFRVLLTHQLPDDVLEILCSSDLEIRVDIALSALSQEDLHKACHSYDAMIILLSDRITASMIENSRVQIIANYAVGYNNIDIEAAQKEGIIVSNTPDVLTDASADLAFALLMSVARRMPEADTYCRNGQFVSWDPLLMLGADIAHQTLGIVGAGRIGSAVAKRATGFSMPMLYTSRSSKPEMDKLGAKRVHLAELLSQSDFVSLHTDLNPTTHHIINAQALQRMKPTAFLINTSRGSVIDEEALVLALENGEIAGAGLDVFEDEPAIHPRLLQQKNVVLAPHIGSATTSTRRKMAQMAANNVVAVLRGKTAINPVY